MKQALGILVFARHDSARLPGKALLAVGGMPLLERVIRRASLTPWPVHLATTDLVSDDALATLAQRLGVPAYRGSAERVLERALRAAEAFGLDAFIRLCGDRPLFPIDAMTYAGQAMASGAGSADRSGEWDLVTNWPIPGAPPGLTTEVIRTSALRQILDRGITARQQEHITQYFYEHPREFRILHLPTHRTQYTCPGFAVDTAKDLENLNRIFSVSGAIDLGLEEADRLYTA